MAYIAKLPRNGNDVMNVAPGTTLLNKIPTQPNPNVPMHEIAATRKNRRVELMAANSKELTPKKTAIRGNHNTCGQ
jgi:hypothetical protein